MTELCVRRLRRELQALSKSPIDNIEAVPLETNIREWHFVITGAKGSAYEGGFYHGKLEFTKARLLIILANVKGLVVFFHICNLTPNCNSSCRIIP